MSSDFFPNSWKLCPLEDVMDVIIDYRGKTPKKTESGVPLVTAKIVKDGYVQTPTEFIAEDNYETWMVRGRPEVGDVVLTTEAPLGEAAQLTDSNVALAQRIVTLRGKKGVLSNDYLLCAVQSNYVQHQLEARATGSTVKGIKQSELRKVILPVPPFEEQQRISNILKSISDKILLNSKINQTLEQTAQAIFKSWFVDFDPVKAKIETLTTGGSADDAELAAMRVISAKTLDELNGLKATNPVAFNKLAQTAALFPAAMQDSELGEIPEGWSVKPFSNLAKLDTTSVQPNKSPQKVWEHYSIPAFDAQNAPFYELGETIKSGKYKVHPASILSSKLNPHFQRTWWPELENGELAICSTEFMQFVPINDVHRAFIYGMIVSSPFQQGILERVTGSTGSRQRAQPPQVANMDVVVPQEKIIMAYSVQIHSLHEKAAKNIKQKQVLSALRDALLPKLLSGEIDLTSEVTA